MRFNRADAADMPDGTISAPRIIDELQKSFDCDRFSFRDIAFSDGTNHDVECALWREEMNESWKQLVTYTITLWKCGT